MDTKVFGPRTRAFVLARKAFVLDTNAVGVNAKRFVLDRNRLVEA
ncbi:MAG TPA: hypothetical protein VH394_01190 [Thermoanaerobaculia bacterium]|jgi:hypothetical protein|nr:hypothetical protein [Thermoanaerobaculia bacterium]